MDAWLIILLVLAVVVGNLMLLKHSAKYKFPTLPKKDDDAEKEDGHTQNTHESDAKYRKNHNENSDTKN